MKKLALSMPVKDLYMVGPAYAKRLLKLNINTVADLIHHYPFRYEDYSIITAISQLRPGETVTVRGVVLSCQNVYTKTGKKIQKAVIRDQSGQIEAVWFNQPFLANILKSGINISLSGKVDWFSFKPALISPEYEILKGGADRKNGFGTVHTGRLVPVYPETYGVSSKWLRSRIALVLNSLVSGISDWLPEKIRSEQDLWDLSASLKQIHFPDSLKKARLAKKRLAFDEMFLIQLSAVKRKKQWQKNQATKALKVKTEKIKDFIKSLPFTLTASQQRSVKEILKDLKQKRPMNRLLQGDVGSGKTVVAAAAMYIAFLNGLKSALMAPTEILAQQHLKTLSKLFGPYNIKVSLATGTTGKKKRDKNDWDIIIGTHALIYNRVNISQLALAVIDEQHRFGVEQRAKLIKKGKAPHTLTMTATPIPRTIALTLYGDLDLSMIDEMPKNRKTVKTWIVPPYKRQPAYSWIKKQIKDLGTQAFIVCPLIEESDKETMKDIKAAAAEFDRLSETIFPELKLGLLHGRLKSAEKEKIINQFHKGKLNILVTTPVVEVGIDIANATIMLIEASERFGLSQLHQLRGRVGRSDKQSYCLLFTSSSDKQNLTRLKAMQQYQSGFKLAEIDLKIRGPGEIYGLKQHGYQKLKLASYTDRGLVQNTKAAAVRIFPKIKRFPLLKNRLKNYTMSLVKPN
jgi:ATP-dependent DNA helicase RecG